MAEEKNIQQAEQDLSEQRRVRREKLAALQAEGRDPFRETRLTGTIPPSRSRKITTLWRARP